MSSTTVRFSQFNASLNRGAEGQTVTDFSTPNNAQAKAVAEIIQRVNPDVLLINEFDYFTANPYQPVDLFRQNYLEVSQNGVAPVDYPYAYIAPSNTGIASGFDLNNNGVTVTTPGTPGYGDDAFGFGNFPGQFGMLLLSKYPIDTANIRTFQTFLWKDMPGNLLTADPTVDNPITPVNENLNGFYSQQEQDILRLSSKSHWDVPVQINGQTVHALVSHPTPPVFDGPEDRNGKRNYDEIRFWSDYVTPGAGGYIYDDQGQIGGLAAGSSFVIMGDQNADPYDGDSYNFAIRQLLTNPNLNTNAIPTSPGGPQQAALQGGANASHNGNPAFDTADFADGTPGNLRADYVLPSANLPITNSGIFWPLNTDPTFPLVGTFTPSLPGGFPSSDHRSVYVDIQVGADPTGKTVVTTDFAGQTIFATGFTPTGAAGAIAGTPVPVGGLSSITYDAATNQYYIIADDRSSDARFYTATINLSDGTLDPGDVTFTNATQLKESTGLPFVANSLDPEGIALTQTGTVFISSEGEVSGTRVVNPFISEFDRVTGQRIRSLALPTKFLPTIQDVNGDGTLDTADGDVQLTGVRNNLAFESLTITPDQQFLFTATENALVQDGPAASVTSGSNARILQFNLVTGQAEKEYLYEVDPVAFPPNPITGFNTNGLVDLLAIDNRGTFLALERSFAAGAVGTPGNTGNTIKVYEVSLQGATDISTIGSLTSLTPAQLDAIQPAQKRLVLNLDDLELPTGSDNIEGLTFGPTLADGRQSIVLVSDNNFSPTQFTQILALSADTVTTVTPVVETRPDLLDDDIQDADADDPAIYVHPTDSAKSLVVTVVKNGGLRVYDLSGTLVQTIAPADIRYNNVDLLYGFQLGGETVDLAIATDRNNDKVVFFKINPNATDGNYLTDITDSGISTLFQNLPFEPPYVVDERSAYGIATYKSFVTGDSYVFANRRETGDVVQLKLVDTGNGTITVAPVRNFTVPIPTDAPADTDPQLEGMVVDRETGYLYIGQENVGIWKYYAEPNAGNTGTLIDRVKELGGTNLEDDVEGLTIYYGPNGTGYLLASSQGDNTFVAYSREGIVNDFLGRFAVGPNGPIDSVQESDGADVINVPLGPNYPFGLFVTQDGSNDPAVLVEDDGELENINSNFKFVPWENIAAAFPEPLLIDTTSYNPRNPVARTLANGVASGDTTATSTVLWTRSLVLGEVTFEVSTDPSFTTIVKTVTATVADPLEPVKVDVTGLNPDTTYYYRATDAAGATASGKLETSTALGTISGLRFGVSGDWRGELAPYPAIANADDRNLAFFVEHGDTVYADIPSPALLNPDGTRKEQAETLEEFRIKNAEVYSTRFGKNTWADLRSSTSILATIDDHEVTNDFQGGAPAASDPRFNDTTPGRLINDTELYDNGLQAFQEYNPIRDEFYGATGDDRTANERKLYRANTYGNDAATFLLDTRSFRDPGLPGVTNPTDPVQVGTFLAGSFNPNRTFLGRQQVDDLKADLLKAEQQGVTWKFVTVPEPMQNLGVVGASDRFEGYAAERTEILKFIDDNNINNVVFVAADIHGTVVNNLTYQTAPFGSQIATNAFEISTGSVAFDAPFGPTVVELAGQLGIPGLPPLPVYNSLPLAQREAIVQSLINGQLAPLGYDPVGLDNNLPIANGLIDATLLQGGYTATNTYGWTEFDIDPTTQKLTVTTYGIPYYTEAELLANPTAVTSRTPQIVSQFEVDPTFQRNTRIGTADADVFVGTAADEVFFGQAGADDISGRIGNDLIYGGAGNDLVKGNLGDDTVYGGDGNDTLRGNGGNDQLLGEAGDDSLAGGAGNDVLIGGAGNDALQGNAGLDIFIIALREGTDTIRGFIQGEDRIGLAGTLTFADLSITTASRKTFIRSGSETLAVLSGTIPLGASDFTAV